MSLLCLSQVSISSLSLRYLLGLSWVSISSFSQLSDPTWQDRRNLKYFVLFYVLVGWVVGVTLRFYTISTFLLEHFFMVKSWGWWWVVAHVIIVTSLSPKMDFSISFKFWVFQGLGLGLSIERAAGLLEEDENQDGCSDLRAH